jgi:hypothetical protein
MGWGSVTEHAAGLTQGRRFAAEPKRLAHTEQVAIRPGWQAEPGKLHPFRVEPAEVTSGAG